MRRLLSSLILIVISGGALSQEICTSWDRKIEPDMQMEESVFSLENYNKSTDYLEKIHGKELGHMERFGKANSESYIKGYRLKMLALEAIAKNSSNRAEAISGFCTFLVDEAFYSD